MEILSEKIQGFLDVSYGRDNGRDNGNGNGYGNGYGYGYGNGNGYGYGYGYGNGNGYGDGYGDGYGNGYGDSRDNGNGYGDGYGYGYGDGYGNGYGYGYGNGYGYGYGDSRGIKSINGMEIYKIDGVPTVITQVRGNVAKGYILKRNVYLRSCFLVKQGNLFAHGDTLQEAWQALSEKLFEDMPVEERIEAFLREFPKTDTPYPNKSLFE